MTPEHIKIILGHFWVKIDTQLFQGKDLKRYKDLREKIHNRSSYVRITKAWRAEINTEYYYNVQNHMT